MLRPLLYPLLAMMGGILIGEKIFIPAWYILAGLAALLVLLLPALRWRSYCASWALILLFVCLAGMFNIQREAYKAADHHHIQHRDGEGVISIEGVVLKNEALSGTHHVALISCRRIIKNSALTPVTGNLRLAYPAHLHFEYGDFIRFHTKIRKIRNFYNPGYFDYKRHLNRTGIYASGYVSNDAGIVLIRRGMANSLQRDLQNYRLSLKKLIYLNAPSPEREIIEAMILGNKKSIPDEVRDSFAKTGTSHLLAISGLHVGIVAASSFFLILLLLRSSEFLMLRFNVIKLATSFSFIPVAAYALIAGMGTPVLRSTFMALAFFVALLIGRQRDPYQVLFLAALLILTAMPEALFEISFQLSFAAVFALIHIVPKFSDVQIPFLSGAPRLLTWLVRRIYLLVLVTAAATAGTLPLIAFYFNRISLVTLVANLIAVPLMGMFVLVSALCAIPVAFFSSIVAGFFIKTSSFFAQAGLALIEWLGSLPGASFAIFKPSVAEIIVFYVGLFLLIGLTAPRDKENKYGWTRRSLFVAKALVLACVFFFIADTAYWIVKVRYNSELKITAIDVGQGSSTLVQMPHGINMLIDGGGLRNSSFDMGKSVIAPCLHMARVSKIDIVVLTHPHPDHLQGLIHILNNFNVREVWQSGNKSDDELFRLFEKAIQDHDIRVRIISADTPPVVISGVAFDYVWPPALLPDTGKCVSHDELNDASLVFKMTFGRMSFLVTGDISRRTEEALIKSGRNLRADLLFVPHHGSVHSSSEAFIGAVSPRYALVSAGRNNIFGHPHREVLKRYLSSGIEMMRTDSQGAIIIRSSGDDLRVVSTRQ